MICEVLKKGFITRPVVWSCKEVNAVVGIVFIFYRTGLDILNARIL